MERNVQQIGSTYRPGAVAVGLLDTSGRGRRFARGLRGELLAGAVKV